MLRRATQGGGGLLIGAAHTAEAMYGGAKNGRPGLGGADRFVFAPDNGADTTCHFDNGRDRFDLTAVASLDIHSFSYRPA